MSTVQFATIWLVLTIIGSDAGQFNICRYRSLMAENIFSKTDIFYKFSKFCRDYEDDAALTGATFEEHDALWIRRGTITDIDLLLNGSLANVTHLKITDMSAEGRTPIRVFPIQSMRFAVLSLKNNGIERLEISGIDHKLSYLDVSENKLEDLGEVKLLLGLKILNMDGNRLVRIDMAEFENMTELVTLSLAGNQIQSVSTEKEISLMRLKNIKLSSNQLVSLDVLQWHFPQLSQFYLHDNRLIYIVDLPKRFPKLEQVSVGGTNDWSCFWFDAVFEYVWDTTGFAIMYPNHDSVPRMQCPNQSRLGGSICCTDLGEWS